MLFRSDGYIYECVSKENLAYWNSGAKKTREAGIINLGFNAGQFKVNTPDWIKNQPIFKTITPANASALNIPEPKIFLIEDALDGKKNLLKAQFVGKVSASEPSEEELKNAWVRVPNEEKQDNSEPSFWYYNEITKKSQWDPPYEGAGGKRKTKKSQILLIDTQRRFDDFVNKLKYRKNGKYEDVPHFIVTKLGTVYQLFDSNHTSNTFDNFKIDKKQIKIAVENLGWLTKNTITGVLNNWIGDPYRSEPYVRSWRNYFFWDKYTEAQVESLSKLCSFLCDKHDIFKQIVPSQGIIESIVKFEGIVCKSNFSNIYTDINPSFNFEVFFNQLKNEKQRIQYYEKDVENN